MAFKLFSRSAPETSAELASNSEFSSFSHSQYGATAAEAAAEPDAGAGPSEAADAAGGVRGLLQRMRSGAMGESAANVKLPLIGHLPSQRQLSLLTTTLGVSIMLSVLFVAWNAYNSGVASTRTQIASDVLMHSQRIGKAAGLYHGHMLEFYAQFTRKPQRARGTGTVDTVDRQHRNYPLTSSIRGTLRFRRFKVKLQIAGAAMIFSDP